MANLPEKNIVTVGKVTSIPSNTNVFINANGEFVQASINDVVRAGNQFGEFSGNLILAKGTPKGYVTGFECYGNSTQDEEPTSDKPIEIKSVGDKGYFDGRLLNGVYNNATGAFSSLVFYVCSKNPIPCKEGDKINVKYGVVANAISIVYYDSNMNQVNYVALANVSEIAPTAPANASYFHFSINENGLALTPQTAKHICVTINGMYALIIKISNAETDATKKQTLYIPLTEPLRKIGEARDKICILDDIYGVLRKIGYIEAYNSEIIETDYMSTTGKLTVGASIQYVLDKNVFEPFADQTPFYSMKTFDGGTLISSEAEMDVEVPMSRAGGVASIGYAKGNLAEIEMQNIKTKLTELQTAVVDA